MFAAGDSNGSELFCGRAIFVHMGTGDECVKSRNRGAEGNFKLRMAGRRLHFHGLVSCQSAAQTVRHRDQDGGAHAADNRSGSMMQDRKGRASARTNAHAIAREYLHILGHCFGVIHIWLGHRIAGDQPVDLILRDMGIYQRAARRINA